MKTTFPMQLRLVAHLALIFAEVSVLCGIIAIRLTANLSAPYWVFSDKPQTLRLYLSGGQQGLLDNFRRLASTMRLGKIRCSLSDNGLSCQGRRFRVKQNIYLSCLNAFRDLDLILALRTEMQSCLRHRNCNMSFKATDKFRWLTFCLLKRKTTGFAGIAM